MAKLSADELGFLEFKYFSRDLPVPFSTEQYIERRTKEFLDTKKVMLALIDRKIKTEDEANEKLDEMLKEMKEKLLGLMQDEPQIKINPILVKELYEFNYCKSMLFFQKNEYIDIYDIDSMVRVMSMNEIDLLVYLLNEHKDKKDNQQKFSMVFDMVCDTPVKTIDVLNDDGRTKLVINDDIVFTNDDFVKFRDIVGYYNISDYKPRFYINNDVKREIESYNNLKFKEYKPLTLEKQVNVLSILAHIKESEIYDMSLRRFYLTDESATDILEWSVNRIVEGGGHFTFKTPIEHYKYKKRSKNDNYGFVPLQEMQSKIQGGI